MEWPITWLRTVEPLPKFDHELLLLRRFSSDQAIVTGRHAYGHLKPGADPPDATAITDAGTIGVESTALTAGDRRRAQDRFSHWRSFTSFFALPSPITRLRLLIESTDGTSTATSPKPFSLGKPKSHRNPSLSASSSGP
jgi:hypothetical protein